MLAYRNMIIVIAVTVAIAAGLHFMVFGPLLGEWNSTEREIRSNISRFSKITHNLPIDISNYQSTNKLLTKYQEVIAAERQSLEHINNDLLPVYAPSQETSQEVLLENILDRLRRTATIEQSLEEAGTRIQILENLGIGVDQAPGRNDTKGFRASPDTVRSYLVLRPTEPNRPRISGVSGTIEFWFKPHWTPTEDRRFHVLLLACSQFNEAALLDSRNNEAFAENYIAIYSAGEVLTAAMKTEDYLPLRHSTSISLWRANEWHHIALLYNQGNMRFYLDGQYAGELEDDQSGPSLFAETGSQQRNPRRGGRSARRPRRGTTTQPEERGGVPTRAITVYNLVELHVGGMPDFSMTADGVFDDLRIRETLAFRYQPDYTGDVPHRLFYEDFEDEFIPPAQFDDAMIAAQSARQIIHDPKISPAVIQEKRDQLGIIRSMLGGISLRQTRIAPEFSSLPKRLYAGDVVGRVLDTAPSLVLSRLDFEMPSLEIIRELFFYLVVSKDLAEHALQAKLDGMPMYRYLGGSKDVNDVPLRQWIERKLKTMKASDLLGQDLDQLNARMRMDNQDTMEQLAYQRRVLQQALVEKFPPHWVRELYASSQTQNEGVYRRLLLELVVEGDIVAITRFVYLLEQKTHLVSIEEMEMEKQGPMQLRTVIRFEAHFIDPPPPLQGETAATGTTPGPQG